MYSEAINLLTSKGRFHIELGLDRIKSVLELFGNPQDDLKYIHVAGTNGKGSVCAMLASILAVRFDKVGLYTSPHIFEYTERIKINGKEISANIRTEIKAETEEFVKKTGRTLFSFVLP